MQREGGWSPARALELERSLMAWSDMDDLVERVWPYVMSHMPRDVGLRRLEACEERVEGSPLIVVDLEMRELVVASGRRVVFVGASGESSSWEHDSDVLVVVGGWGEWMSVSGTESKRWGAGPVAWSPLEYASTREFESHGGWSWSARSGSLVEELFDVHPECALRAGWTGRVEAGAMTLEHDFEPGTTSAIGRSVRCELCVRDPHLARRHTTIEVSRDPERGIVGEVADMGSTNGTYVNGRSVRRHALKDHEIVLCATVALTMRRVMWSVR